jgi:hypothetical protein
MWTSRERRAGQEDQRIAKASHTFMPPKSGLRVGFDGAVIAAPRALFFVSREAFGCWVCLLSSLAVAEAERGPEFSMPC